MSISADLDVSPEMLLELSLLGDHASGLKFANLVFDSKYLGDFTVGGTKASARLKCYLDAENSIVRGAESGYLPSIIEAAEMYFTGRRESLVGKGLIVPVKYKKSQLWNERLLEMNSGPETKANFRIGACVKMLSLFDSDSVNWDNVLCFWEASGKGSDYWASLSRASIGDYYFSIKREYDKAILCYESASEKCSVGVSGLALAYQLGRGVEKDSRKAEQLWKKWDSMNKPS